MIEIRAALENDVPNILGLIQELAEYEKLSHAVRATGEQLRITLFGERPGAEVLMAFFGDECAGFALFFPNYSTFLAQPGIYLEDLYVKAHLRGRGIGSALLREISRLAVLRRCGRVEWSVLDWNAPSIGFYQGLGAVAMDEWTVYRLSGDALVELGGR